MSNSHEARADSRPVLSLGRYVLYGEIASGGMATVHFGRMTSVGGFARTVAIKRMRTDIARDPEFVAMFLDEAHISSRIEHPNVVRVLDVVAEGDEVFLVMEYVRGESLERLRRKARKRKQPIPVPVAVNIIYGTLNGLHAAHEAIGEDGKPLGIVHRDVSPPNILVSEEGVARITDFGIAKAESRLQTTQDGQMKGKIPYMAPEQLRGLDREADRRIDVFAAGVVFWELLASRYLFRGDHPAETLAKVLSAPIPHLHDLRPDVPTALDLCIQKALAREPNQRYASAEQFAEAIEEAMGGRLGTRKKVGAWVKSLAQDELGMRTRYVRQIESSSWKKNTSGELASGLPSRPGRDAQDSSSSGLRSDILAQPPQAPLEPKVDFRNDSEQIVVPPPTGMDGTRPAQVKPGSLPALEPSRSDTDPSPTPSGDDVFSFDAVSELPDQTNLPDVGGEEHGEAIGQLDGFGIGGASDVAQQISADLTGGAEQVEMPPGHTGTNTELAGAPIMTAEQRLIEAQAKKQRTVKIVGIVSGVSVAVIVSLLLIFSGGDAQSEKSSPSPSSAIPFPSDDDQPHVTHPSVVETNQPTKPDAATPVEDAAITPNDAQTDSQARDSDHDKKHSETEQKDRKLPNERSGPKTGGKVFHKRPYLPNLP